MLLALDIGNTHTLLALFDTEGSCLRQWRMNTQVTDTSDELQARLFGFFQMSGFALDQVTDVAISVVVPALRQSWQQALEQALGLEPFFVDGAHDCGIALNVVSPRTVGGDRIANAVSAQASYGAPVIVVDFGTATNIDVVDASGAFRGGAIMPGLRLSAQALFDRAAMLSSVPLVLPAYALGDDTETNVQSGLVLGAAAQAEGLVRRIQAELAAEGENLPPATVVATGGHSSVIAPGSDIFDAVDPDLTIRGIYLIWRHAKAAQEQAK